MRIQKLNEAKRLLNNEPEPRAPRSWILIDGICDQPGHPDEVQEQDIVFHIHIIKENDPEMIAHRKSCGIVE